MSPEQRAQFNRYWRRKTAFYRQYFQDRLESNIKLYDPEWLLLQPKLLDWDDHIFRFTINHSTEVYSLPRRPYGMRLKWEGLEEDRDKS